MPARPPMRFCVPWLTGLRASRMSWDTVSLVDGGAAVLAGAGEEPAARAWLALGGAVVGFGFGWVVGAVVGLLREGAVLRVGELMRKIKAKSGYRGVTDFCNLCEMFRNRQHPRRGGGEAARAPGG